MATLKQIEANRRNALHSTGPKTPQGKAAVRLNSLRHGGYAKILLLPGEKREDYDQLCEDLERDWEPQTRTEQEYVEEMATCVWKKIRLQVAENRILNDRQVCPRDQVQLADVLWKAQARLRRSFTQAQHELERLQEQRRQSAQPAEAPMPAESPSAPAPRLNGNGHDPAWINSPPPPPFPRCELETISEEKAES
jgi:hypothetical protein